MVKTSGPGRSFPVTLRQSRPLRVANGTMAAQSGLMSVTLRRRSREYFQMQGSKQVLAAIALSTASALALGACSSPAERAAENTAEGLENQADTLRDNAEGLADNMEDKADTLDNRVDGVDSNAEQSTEDRAQGVRNSADRKADALEEKADAARDNAN